MLNIGFHKPKKDQCSTCITYTEEKPKNTDYEEKDYGSRRKT